jgi:hypothetical protein
VTRTPLLVRCASPWGVITPTTYALRAIHRQHDVVVIVSELASNDGLSVTNNAEQIHAQLVARYGESVRHVEHYDHESYSRFVERPATYDEVTLDSDGHARWRYLADTLRGALAQLDS